MALPASLQSPFGPVAIPPTSARPLHIVLACTGSVASIKVPLIAEALAQYRHVHVLIVPTKDATHFFDCQALGAQSKAYTVEHLAAWNAAGTCAAHAPRLHVWTDEAEWSAWNQPGDPVLHIELRRWADVVLLAPCSANTLAKIANGLCDNLLTCFLRALASETPTYLFPAMNTLMYMHPITAKHLHAVQALGYQVHGPITKRLACGDQGTGAMLD
ncbi:hypothetical protein MVES_003317 [Malassezia vespertilionis]|uniref:Flavoprotein domain-containing protein n=1 Tax=Malassezia vespertilionis TaxID=2020962 RepID=A0A2N1J8Q0_9BASI|nr:hypothetical protein MVES_003317 [Malassezia vespertilionis]